MKPLLQFICVVLGIMVTLWFLEKLFWLGVILGIFLFVAVVLKGVINAVNTEPLPDCAIHGCPQTVAMPCPQCAAISQNR